MMNGQQQAHPNGGMPPPSSQSPPLPNLQSLSISPYGGTSPVNDYRYNGVFGPPVPAAGTQGWNNPNKRGSRSGLPPVSRLLVITLGHLRLVTQPARTDCARRIGTTLLRVSRPILTLTPSGETPLRPRHCRLLHLRPRHQRQDRPIRTRCMRSTPTTATTLRWVSPRHRLRSSATESTHPAHHPTWAVSSGTIREEGSRLMATSQWEE